MIYRMALMVTLLLLAGCNQNMESVKTDETLENSPKPAVDPDARPLARPDAIGTPPSEGAPGRGKMSSDDVPPFVKAYFMHNFVEALYSKPKNFNPNPKWESPLKDPEKGRVWCTDCHVSTDVDFSRIPKQRMPLTDQYEKDKVYMVGLMKKWVARLNSDEFFAKAKLKHEVTCTTCHETNPEEALRK